MFKNFKIRYCLIIIASIILLIFMIKHMDLYNKKRIAIEYLNNKYGDGEWKIVSTEDYKYTNPDVIRFYEYRKDGVIFKISSSYLNNTFFELDVNNANMVTNDYFLPTYYSIKYNLEYDSSTNNFRDLVSRMVYITRYHYPYNDYVYESSGWYFERPKCLINSFLMNSAFFPISVQKSPNKEKVLDIIPDNQSIPEISEIIHLVEEFYSSGRLRNKENNDKELYDLVFTQKASDEEIQNYILNHITPVQGLDILKIKQFSTH